MYIHKSLKPQRGRGKRERSFEDNSLCFIYPGISHTQTFFLSVVEQYNRLHKVSCIFSQILIFVLERGIDKLHKISQYNTKTDLCWT